MTRYSKLEVISQASRVINKRIFNVHDFIQYMEMALDDSVKKFGVDNVMYFMIPYEKYYCVVTPSGSLIAINNENEQELFKHMQYQEDNTIQ